MITTTVKYRQIGSIGQGISSKDDSSIVTELLDEESFYMNIYNTDANAAVGIATTSLIEDPGDFEFQVSPGGQDFISLGEDYCVSLIESVMDSEDFAGWPFGR